MSRWLRVRWRLDRVAALLLAVVSAPLAGGLWLVVRIIDGPPAIVRLPRVGRGGTEFAMAKFRSMAVADAGGRAGGSELTSGNDPRVTPLGQRLRHHRLDELPQLANVIRGQMALLGPRPETIIYVDLEDPRWQRVVQAVPGIAGPTQVVIHDYEAGISADDLKRYEAEMVPVKLAIDQWYLEHASPAVDLLVVLALLALLERFVARRSVTVLHRRLRRELPEVAALFDRHASPAPDVGPVPAEPPLQATTHATTQATTLEVPRAHEHGAPSAR